MFCLIAGFAHGEEFLYLDPFVDGRAFEGEIEVYTEDYQTLYVSSDSLKSVLDIYLERQGDSVSGWYFFQNNQLHGRFSTHSVLIGDQSRPLRESDFIQQDDQTYVDSDLIERWFDIQVSVELNRLLINFNTNGRHPYFEARKRQSRYTQVDNLKAEEQSVRVIDNEYQWLTWPSSDVRLSQRVTDPQQTMATGRTVFDLAGHSVDFLASSTSSATLDQTRYRLTARREVSWQDNGFYYEVGDVYFPAGKFLRTSFGGRGVAIHGNRLSQQHSRNFQIEGLPGWEVELYRDNQLIDYSTLDEVGQYRFEGVDISAGHNQYKAILYGPNGEVREKRFDFNVTNQGLYRGRWLPELYLIEPNQPLLGEGGQSDSAFEQMAVGRLHYGLTDHLNLGVGTIVDVAGRGQSTPFTELFYVDERQVFDLGIGAPTEEEQYSYSADYSINASYGTFMLSQYSTYLYDQGLFQDGRSARWQHSFADYNLGLSVNQQTVKNIEQRNWDASIGTRLGDNHISNRLNYQDNEHFDVLSVARLVVGGHLLQIRGGYRQNGPLQDKLSYIGWRRQYGQHSLHLNAAYATLNDRLTLNTEYSIKYDRFNLGTKLTHDSGSGFAMVVNFSTAFAWDAPVTSMRQTSYSHSARVRTQAYWDRNNNQKLDQDDEPLAGVKYKGSYSWQTFPSDEQGQSVIYGVQSYQPQYLEVDTEELDNPFISPLQAKYKITSHPGGEVLLDIPFYDIFEVEGDIVLIKGEGVPIGRPGVPVQLIKGGEVVQQVTTEYDGYFLFDRVLPGHYQIELDPRYLSEKSLVQVSNKIIDINLNRNSDALVILEPMVLAIKE